MKKTIFLVIAVFTSLSFASADSSCSKYYPLEEGTSFQYTNYNKKGKVEGFADYLVTKTEELDGKTRASMSVTYTDKKGKEMFETGYGVTCTGTGISIDFQSLFPAQMKQQYEDMGVAMEMSGADIELPNHLEAGMALADANIEIAIKMVGMQMKVAVGIHDRVVEKMESVTTEAGTFDCFVITDTTNTKVMMKDVQMNSKLWLAEGVGMVRQETYNNKGALVSRAELTRFNQ